MVSPQYHSSLSCELRIIKAKNIEIKSNTTGGLFVRYYLSSGNNTKTIQLNSQEISSTCEQHIWNESFSLECLGTEDSINNLSQQTVVFELRWRSTVPNFLGQKSKSKLLGRAEVPWKTVFESQNMEIESWVMMVPKNSNRVLDVKPPSIQVAIKVRVPTLKVEMVKKKKWNECGCTSSRACSCSDYEAFALVAAFEAL